MQAYISRRAARPVRSGRFVNLSVPRFGDRGSDFWIRFSEIGIRGSGLWIRVSEFGIRDSVFGIWDAGFGIRVSGFGFQKLVSSYGFRVGGLGFRTSGVGSEGRCRSMVEMASRRGQGPGSRSQPPCQA